MKVIELESLSTGRAGFSLIIVSRKHRQFQNVPIQRCKELFDLGNLSIGPLYKGGIKALLQFELLKRQTETVCTSAVAVSGILQ
jgi:hypothetical protein